MSTEFQSLSLLEMYYKTIFVKVNLKVMVVVEMSEDAPTNLNLKHLYTFLLKSNESFDSYCCRLLLFALFLYYILNGSYVFSI
jgi:hypothetical protein